MVDYRTVPGDSIAQMSPSTNPGTYLVLNVALSEVFAVHLKGYWGFKWLLEPSGTQLINTHVSTALQSL